MEEMVREVMGVYNTCLRPISNEEFEETLPRLVREAHTASELLLAARREFGYGQSERLTTQQAQRVFEAIVDFKRPAA